MSALKLFYNKDNQDIVANIQKKLTTGIHIVFWLVLCLIELEKEL